jgi:hypothetical protein
MDKQELAQKLKEEVDKAKKNVRTDSYPMSIGEVISMYERGEIILNPTYQRFYRWNYEQKTRLIESILIGLPLPSIFVAQTDDGPWEVVDGLQRLSTILEFVGVLKESDKSSDNEVSKDKFNTLSDSIENGLFYLPNFANKSWSDLGQRIQIDFRTSKVQLTILLRGENNTDAKFEMFQRLNSGGLTVSPQELRNAILADESPDMFKFLTECTEDDNFKKVTGLSEEDIKTRFDMELVLRFILILEQKYYQKISNFKSVSTFLTHSLRELIESKTFNYQIEKERFEKTFSLINQACGQNALNVHKQEIGNGKFSIVAFETIAIGIAQNIEHLSSNDLKFIKEKSDNCIKDEEYKKATGSGKNFFSRIKVLLNLGKKYFEKP